MVLAEVGSLPVMGTNLGDLPEIPGTISDIERRQYNNRQILCKLFLAGLRQLFAYD
jgi:hypothetical protein